MFLLLKAVVLGIIEGLTEFVPVSSTGHLIVGATLLDYPQAHRATFEIFIQLGAILAVFWHYRNDLLALIARSPGDHAARALIGKVGFAFLPAACVGLLLHQAIEKYLFSVPTVAGALIVGGIALVLVESFGHRIHVSTIEDTRWRDAMWVGIAQVASLFPGVSRAAATIVGGLLTGMDRPTATQFSFYLALPTVTAASLFSLAKSLPDLHAADAAPLAAGFVAAFVTALGVIRLFLAYVRRHDFRIFGYYRIVAGLLLFLL